jgi:hypothetical protein
MSNGSGLFTDQGARLPHLVEGKGGVPGEVDDLRRDVATSLLSMAAISVDEYIDPLATSAVNMMAATDSQITEDELLPDATPAVGVLTQATIDDLATGGPRQLLFTVAGVTPAERAPTATVYGTAVGGAKATEVVALPDVAGEALTGTFFIDIDKVVLAAGSGTAATVSIGLGALLGLGAPVVSRAGLVAVIQEVAIGVVVTTGTVSVGATTAATETGSVDMTGLGYPAALDGYDFDVAVDGGTPITVTFSSPADEDAVVSQINTQVGQDIASLSGNNLKLDSLTTGAGSSLNLVAGGTDALTVMGITAGYYQGTDGGKGTYAPAVAPDGTKSYALYYEYDPTA